MLESTQLYIWFQSVHAISIMYAWIKRTAGLIEVHYTSFKHAVTLEHIQGSYAWLKRGSFFGERKVLLNPQPPSDAVRKQENSFLRIFQLSIVTIF